MTKMSTPCPRLFMPRHLWPSERQLGSETGRERGRDLLAKQLPCPSNMRSQTSILTWGLVRMQHLCPHPVPPESESAFDQIPETRGAHTPPAWLCWQRTQPGSRMASLRPHTEPAPSLAPHRGSLTRSSLWKGALKTSSISVTSSLCKHHLSPWTCQRGRLLGPAQTS